MIDWRQVLAWSLVILLYAVLIKLIVVGVFLVRGFAAARREVANLKDTFALIRQQGDAIKWLMERVQPAIVHEAEHTRQTVEQKVQEVKEKIDTVAKETRP